MFPFSPPPWSGTENEKAEGNTLIHAWTVLFFQFDKSYAVHQIKLDTPQLQELGWQKSVGFTSTFCLILHKNDIFYYCTHFFYDDSPSIVPHNAIKYKDCASSFFLEEHTDIRFWAAVLSLEVMFLSLYPLKGFYQLLLGYLAC